MLTAAAAGAVLSLLLAVAVRPGGAGWAAWIFATVGIAGWVLGSGVATARFGRVPMRGVPAGITAAFAAIGAYASFIAGLLALLLAGSAAGSAPFLTSGLARSGLGHLPAEQVLLVAAALLLQISTANLIVRLLLDLVVSGDVLEVELDALLGRRGEQPQVVGECLLERHVVAGLLGHVPAVLEQLVEDLGRLRAG